MYTYIYIYTHIYIYIYIYIHTYIRYANVDIRKRKILRERACGREPVPLAGAAPGPGSVRQRVLESGGATCLTLLV